MELYLSFTDYAVAIGILIVPVAIGILYAVKDADNMTRSEYLLGGRRMSIMPVATSLFITFISGISMIGIPAEVYFFGFIYILLPVGHAVNYLIGSVTLVPLTHPLRITSIYEYLKLRYKSENFRRFSSIFGVLTQISYMTVSMLAPALALHACAGVPLWVSTFVLGILGTLYTAIGGIKSVIWTDAFQTAIAFFGVAVILVKACLEVGGLGEIWRIGTEGGRTQLDKFSIDPRVRHTVWSLVIGLAITRLNQSFSQSTLQRISCMRTLREARTMYLLNIPLTVVFDAVMALVGLAIYAYFSSRNCDPFKAGLIKNRNQIAPFFVLYSMDDLPGMAGLFISFLCCGSLSTLSSGINSLAANTVEDILHGSLSRFKESTITLITKIIAAGYGLLIIILTFLATNFKGPVNQMIGIALGALGSPITGVFLMGGAIPWVNKYGAFVGVLASVAVNLFISIGSLSEGVYLPSLPSAGEEGCFNSTSQHLYLNTTTTAASPPAAAATAPLQDEHFDKFFLFAISYEWYSIIGVSVCVGVGVAVSFLVNRMAGEDDKEWQSTESKYIFPFMRKFWGMDEPNVENYTYSNVEMVISDEKPGLGGNKAV